MSMAGLKRENKNIVAVDMWSLFRGWNLVVIANSRNLVENPIAVVDKWSLSYLTWCLVYFEKQCFGQNSIAIDNVAHNSNIRTNIIGI
jgi:hypothetical protein